MFWGLFAIRKGAEGSYEWLLGWSMQGPSSEAAEDKPKWRSQPPLVVGRTDWVFLSILHL